MKFINKSFKRSYVLGLALSVSVLISACGGGGGSNTKVGVFTDSPVEGLAYSGPNFSGLTNANGEFNYMEGDEITFSLGGIMFGSAPGAPTINPFDLFGVTAPTTEGEIKSELQKQSSGFNKAMNIVTLLVSLDKDGNPDNGLNISGFDDELQNISVSIDQNALEFASRVRYELMSEGEKGFSDDFDQSKPLVHFYESLGITISTKALVKTSRDEGNDEVIDYVSAKTFNEAFQIATTTEDSDGDGNNDQTTSYTYDANGNQTFSLSQQDRNDDGVIDDNDREYTNGRTYDGDGRILTRTNGRLGTSGYQNVNTFTYDEAGNLISDVYTNDGGNDGINSRTTNTYTYNADGLRLTYLRESDNNGDDTIDSTTKRTYTYDEDGNELTEITENDRDIATNPGIDSVYSNVYTYDENGNRLTSISENDYDNDETIDNKETTVRTYDARDNQLTRLSEYDEDNDGVIDSRNSSTSTYDENDRELTETYKDEYNLASNSPTSYENSYTYTYDGSGNLLSEVSVDKRDGEISQQRRETYTYDNQNRQTSFVSERDRNGDGMFTSGESISTTYDENGKTTEIIRLIGVPNAYTYKTVVSATYNSAGAQTSYTYIEDNDNDGTDDKKVEITHTLDVDNNIISSKEDIYDYDDNDNDLARTLEVAAAVSEENLIETNVTDYEYITIQDGLEYLLNTGIYENPECSLANNQGFGIVRALRRGSSRYCQSSGFFFDD